MAVQLRLLRYLFHPQRLGDGFVDHGRVEQDLLGRERSVHDDLLLGRDVQRHVRLESSEQEGSENLKATMVDRQLKSSAGSQRSPAGGTMAVPAAPEAWRLLLSRENAASQCRELF